MNHGRVLHKWFLAKPWTSQKSQKASIVLFINRAESIRDGGDNRSFWEACACISEVKEQRSWGGYLPVQCLPDCPHFVLFYLLQMRPFREAVCHRSLAFLPEEAQHLVALFWLWMHCPLSQIVQSKEPPHAGHLDTWRRAGQLLAGGLHNPAHSSWCAAKLFELKSNTNTIWAFAAQSF